MFEFVDPVVVSTAAVAGFLTGAVWYSLVGGYWRSALGKTQEEITRRFVPFVVAAIANFVTAYLLANLLSQFGVDSGEGGLAAAALVWLGFTIPYMAMNHSFAGTRISLTLIDGLHSLAAMCVMGYVIGMMSRPGI